MSQKLLWILNSVEDAHYFLLQKIENNECIICVTNASICDYLDSKNISSINLSKYLSNEDIINKLKESDELVNRLLDVFDRLLAEDISSILNIKPQRYFRSRYGYLLKFDYVGQMLFQQAVFDIVTEFNIDTIHCFNCKIPGSTSINFEEILNIINFKNNVDIKYFVRSVDSRSKKSENIFILKYINKLKTCIQYPHKILPYFLDFLRHQMINIYHLFFSTDQVILSLDVLREFSFLKYRLKKYEFLEFSNYNYNNKILSLLEKNKTKDISEKICNLFDNFNISEVEDLTSNKIPRYFTLNLFNHIKNNFPKDLIQLLEFKRYLLKHKVVACIWGLPPCLRNNSLFAEYCINNGVPVLGFQHGGNYITQNLQFVHFDSYFSRCTHFFSYGFTSDDANKVYPKRKVDCEVIPSGSYYESLRQRKKRSTVKNVDILFPLTNSMSMFTIGRINGFDLAQYQISILDYLENIPSNKNIVAKPFSEYNSENCAVFKKLKSLKKVKVNTLHLASYLQIFTPKVVIIEYPSSPLFEMIGQEVEIFLMLDPVSPFSKDALSLLEKRVHIFSRVEDLFASLDDYLEGLMPKRRNNEFYNKYIYKADTEEIILNSITSILNQNINTER